MVPQGEPVQLPDGNHNYASVSAQGPGAQEMLVTVCWMPDPAGYCLGQLLVPSCARSPGKLPETLRSWGFEIL